MEHGEPKKSCQWADTKIAVIISGEVKMNKKEKDQSHPDQSTSSYASAKKKAITCFVVSFIGLLLLGSVFLAPTREAGEAIFQGLHSTVMIEVVRVAPIFVQYRNDSNSAVLKSNLDSVIGEAKNSHKNIALPAGLFLDDGGKTMAEFYGGSPHKFAFDYWLYIIFVPAIAISLVISLGYSRFIRRRAIRAR